MKNLNLKRIYLILLGFVALCWFLIRVIPKPSRATYPCQQAAFPIASAFVIWLTSLFVSAVLIVKFKKSFQQNKMDYAFLFLILFGITFLIYSSISPENNLIARSSSNYDIAFYDGATRTDGLTDNITSNFDEVAIVKSSQQYASNIDIDEIEAMVRESVEMAGGINEIVSNGDYVVLKPNLVEMTPDSSYDEISGMATDWRVAKAVAKMVRELNPEGKIYIIECSAATSTRDILNFYNYTLENFPEVDQIVALEDSCGAFEDYADVNLDQVFLEDSVRLYPDEEKPNLSPEFYMNKIYNNADVVISIPVLKNHKTAIITGGVKNVAIGMTPPNIYGMTETFFGKWTKIDHSVDNLNKWLHDYYLCKPVDFVVVDGLQGFDHGPTGIPELSMEEMQHNMRLIIAGKRALSVDAICGQIMSLDPTYCNYMVYLDKEEYGVGTIDSRFIRPIGEQIADIRDVFQHDVGVALNAIHSDYEPPAITVNSALIEENTITFEIDSDEDLNKIELEVNGVLLDHVCISDFASVTFEVSEELLPFETARLFAYDRFFNLTQLTFENLAIDENNFSFATLHQNFPNPFTTSTNIGFTLQKSETVKLFVSDINGKLIETIINGKLVAGEHEFEWKENTTSGIYFYTIEVGGKRITKQMIKK